MRTVCIGSYILPLSAQLTLLGLEVRGLCHRPGLELFGADLGRPFLLRMAGQQVLGA